jgi:imidazolonepropionase
MTDTAVYTADTVATLAEGSPYGLLEHGAVAVDDGRIVWVGAAGDLPHRLAGASRIDYGAALLTPALVDCHTHLVHGGNRAAEWERRLEGVSYAEIARAGGGILATVRATRAASEDALLEAALVRLDDLLADGVGTVEVKSGYGLDVETELRMLRVARCLGEMRPVRVVTTFLGAHAIPPGHTAESYLPVCLDALRAAHADGLVDAVDGFCETIAFSRAQIAEVFDVAAELDLPVKLHAEQLSDLGGAALVAARGGLSADHLEYLSAEGVAAMAAAGTVAVLLPGAFYTLRETQAPPVAALRAAGVPIAVATDLNPGSSPLHSLTLAMNMGCTLFRLTPSEVLAGATRVAARALGLRDGTGTLAPGAPAHLAVWHAAAPAELAYAMGRRALKARIHAGRVVA